jgi:protein phosphatase
MDNDFLSEPESDDISDTRRLTLEAVVAAHNAHLIFGQATDQGLVRSNNQDSLLSFYSTSHSDHLVPDFGIFIVADGMGGHSHGEKASSMAVHLLTHELVQSLYLPLLAGSDPSDLPPVLEVLVAAMQQANTQIREQIEGESGTTCTLAVLLGSRIYLAHAGDSRAYLIKQDRIEQLSRDHSLGQRMVELGEIRREELATYERGHELYRTLGINEKLEIDTLSRSLAPSSRLLLCSDGVWNHLDDDSILETVQQYEDPQAACNQLIVEANARGGRDNISALIIEAK